MNYKTIVAASGIAVMVLLSPVFPGSERFALSFVIPNDPCAEGFPECRYVFTAKSGSTKQITMARMCPDCTDSSWYYYDMGFYTKTEVQAGYYYDINNPNNNLVLIVVYSADKEGKSGAIVSRVSTDYGKTWSSSSVNITSNQHKFGLAVAPDSSIVAILNDGKIKLKLIQNDGTWEQFGPKGDANSNISSTGLAVIREADAGDIVSVSYATGKKIGIRNFNLRGKTWDGFHLQPGDSYKTYRNDTAWLKDSASSDYYLAVKKIFEKEYWVGAKKLGVLVTTDLTKKNKYSSFQKWVKKGSYPISGLWQDDDEIIYILSTVNQEIKGTDSNGNISSLYHSNQGSSMQRRVSMFFVPAIE